MSAHADTGPARRFLSLKWKVILLLSLVLLISNVAIILFADTRAREQFHLQQEYTMARLFQTLHKQLEASNANLGRVASLVSLLEPPGTSADTDLNERLQLWLQNYGATLELEWDISQVRFIASAQLQNGQAPVKPELPRRLLELARKAENNGQQAAMLDCRPDCYQHVATPLIDTSGSGVLLVGRSIADLVLQFHHISNARLAFLGPPGNEPANRIDNWQVSVAAISGPREGIPLLRAFASRYTLQQMIEAPRLLKHANAWHLAQLQNGHNDNLRMILYPVSAAINELEARRSSTIYIGIAGLVLAEILMLLFLWRPMDRLRALVSVLPEIGRRGLRRPDALPKARSGAHTLNDEVDLLVHSIGELSENLEASCLARDEAEQHLLWLAIHDPLTNLFNRRHFQQELEKLLAGAQQPQIQGALLYLDLDRFKNVNDLSGHQVGDNLLLQVAAQLHQVVSETDLLARLGGDEFGILIPRCDRAAAERTAENILRQLKDLSVTGKAHAHRVSASIGIALYPLHGGSVGDLMANADLAMYQAKEAGRNRYYLFTTSDQAREHLDLRTRFQDKINHALEFGGFYLHFQPVLDIRQQQVVRHEALIRLRDEDGSVVPPDRFIGVAEYTGQIRDIDRWVVQQVLELLRDDPTLRLAANLSGVVIDDPQMQCWLRDALPTAALRPGQLTFELTETAMVSNIAGAVELMRDMHELGAEFALDDFGSGFASYAYLKQLPVDYVKIDGSFIQGLTVSSDDQLFIKALVEVAHGLGKQVVAEYVEDAPTLELLRKYRVDFAQGYYIGKPDASLASPAWSIPTQAP